MLLLRGAVRGPIVPFKGTVQYAHIKLFVDHYTNTFSLNDRVDRIGRGKSIIKLKSVHNTGIEPAARTYSSYQEKLFAEQLATQLPVAGMKKVNRLLKARIIYP